MGTFGSRRQSRGPMETQFPGKVSWAFVLWTVRAGTDSSYPTGLSACFKMSF